jgi:ABC-type antimicrobial peptide transport system permease subunit
LWLVLENGGKLIGAGVLCGTAAALGLSRLLQSQLFGISAMDPPTFVAVPILILLVGILACLIPARSAAHVDPMIALRNE